MTFMELVAKEPVLGIVMFWAFTALCFTVYKIFELFAPQYKDYEEDSVDDEWVDPYDGRE